MAGAQLLALLDERDPLAIGKRLPHQFAPIADDDDRPLDAAGGKRIKHEIDHRPSRDGNQHLRQIGLHPSPLTRR